MGLTRYILPALAVASTAYAQCSGPLTITTQSDADVLQSCTKYNGDITISDQAQGTIALDGVEQITGDLKCNNATQLSSLTSDQLNSIGGTWSLQSMTTLANLQFDSLTSVDQIYWVGLPALQGLNFAQGIQKATNVLISNTQLYTSSGIELQHVGILNINNNPYLSTVNVNNLKNVTNQLLFSANAMNLQISFPNLLGAANMTFRNVSTVDMPSLAYVAGNMGFYSDTMESFSAPNLTATGGTLAFSDCPELSKTSFPSLVQIGGGFLLANNTNLKAIGGFPALKVVVGAIDFAGTFSSVTLPVLHDVRGGSNVQTTSTNSKICDQFDTAHSNGVIKGVNSCSTGQANPNQNPTATGSGSSSSSSSASSGAAAVNFDPTAPLTGLSALIAAILMI